MTIVTPFFCDCYLAKSFLTCLWASHYCVAYIFSKTQNFLKAYHLAAAHLIDSSARPSAILWTETLGSCFVKKGRENCFTTVGSLICPPCKSMVIFYLSAPPNDCLRPPFP